MWTKIEEHLESLFQDSMNIEYYFRSYILYPTPHWPYSGFSSWSCLCNLLANQSSKEIFFKAWDPNFWMKMSYLKTKFEFLNSSFLAL